MLPALFLVLLVQECLLYAIVMIRNVAPWEAFSVMVCLLDSIFLICLFFAKYLYQRYKLKDFFMIFDNHQYLFALSLGLLASSFHSAQSSCQWISWNK